MSVVAGVSMVKDEADVIAGVLQHMAQEVDFLLVADNGSTDGTSDIMINLAPKLPVPLYVLTDPGVAYYQSEKMSRLAAKAASYGAEWIVPFDADEIWYTHADRLRVVLPELVEPIAYAALTNHFATAVDPLVADPFVSMVWRQPKAQKLGKVAFRWEEGATIHQGNHGVTLPSGGLGLPVLHIRHFPYRSASQMTRKARNGAAAYAATDLPESEGNHWRQYGLLMDRRGPQVMAEVFQEHFFYLSPVDAGLVLDPAPYRRWAE
jgi:glycosyltransferase involved in cell wall biosynthesis